MNKVITVSSTITGEPYKIEADENRLYHMLLNLVDNAIKYSPRETAVSVKVQYDPEQITIQVVDGGPGIPEGDQERIFEKIFSWQ
ncbi:MAG: ATP-binding protein [Chloroflexi bacterium]|nr:ATP-binding protein [Chloroflexota bacterium]